MIDFHNHLMPAVDDGAQDDDEVRHALAAFREQGIDVVVTTPHIDGSLTRRPDAFAEHLARIDDGWARLEAIAADEFPDMTVHRGVEVKLDSPDPDLGDDRMRLAGTRFALVEFPHMMLPPESARALFQATASGWTPIVAHPERYSGIEAQLDVAAEWRRVGAHLQVNQGSIIGRYGEQARANAFALLERGWVDYLASDFHARGRPHARACRDALLERDADEQITLLMDINPGRLLDGEAPIPVPALEKPRGLLGRLVARFRG